MIELINDEKMIDSSSDVRYAYLVTDYHSVYMFVIYGFMAIVGIVGNLLTCLVIVSNKFMHTATNFYLFNLALADLMILFFCCPVNHLIPKNNDFNCQLRFLMDKTSVNVMIMTVTVLSIERYVATCHPFLSTKYNSTRHWRAIKTILMMWPLEFLFSLPLMLYVKSVHHAKDPSVTICIHTNDIGIYLSGLESLLFFLLPMFIVFVMYVLIGLRLSKSAKEIKSNNKMANFSKQRAPKILMIVVAALFVCWMPTYVYNNLWLYSESKPLTGTMVKIADHLLFVSDFLYYSSSLINPIMYNMMSTKFRKALKITLLRWGLIDNPKKAYELEAVFSDKTFEK